VTTKRRIGVEVDGRITGRRSTHSGQGERLQKGENKTRRWESEIRLRVNSPSCAAQPRNSTVVGAHLGRAGQEHKMDPNGIIRLV
jgi:hypothetical protein